MRNRQTFRHNTGIVSRSRAREFTGQDNNYVGRVTELRYRLLRVHVSSGSISMKESIHARHIKVGSVTWALQTFALDRVHFYTYTHTHTRA